MCGHYEGVDERVLERYVDEYISIGDYVLTGGELPALVVADAVCRMLPGVLAEDVCFEEESHYHGLLEYPHYTRPAEWRGRRRRRCCFRATMRTLRNGGGNSRCCGQRNTARFAGNSRIDAAGGKIFGRIT